MRVVREELIDGPVPAYAHPEWVHSFPWLIQGTTSRGSADPPFNLGAFTDEPLPAVQGRWRQILDAFGCATWACARQSHESRVVVHDRDDHREYAHDRERTRNEVQEGIQEGAPQKLHETHGVRILDAVDGHLTDVPSMLLTVTVADCVPVSIVDPERHVVGMVHAGWRGAAAGILEGALDRMTERFGSAPSDLHIHLGPSACAERYEVGPEVHRALGLPDVGGPTPVDLRAALGARALGCGVLPERITRSSFSTLDPDAPFFSHRRGDRGRQVGFVAIRPSDG